MTLYKVKDGCSIQHEGIPYIGGDEIELTPDLALFHAANIEVLSPKVEIKTEVKTVSTTKSDVS